MAESTTMKRGIADQNPMTLCQLKSRALPGNPRRNQVTFLSWGQVHCFGHQM